MSQAPTGAHPFDMIKPDQLAKLPMLSDETRQLYSTGLTKLWNALETNPKDSEQYQTALSKIKAVSKDIMMKMANWKVSNPARNVWCP